MEEDTVDIILGITKTLVLIIVIGAIAYGLYVFGKDCERRGGVVITDGNGNNRCVGAPAKP
jgi:hypothetical protein